MNFSQDIYINIPTTVTNTPTTIIEQLKDLLKGILKNSLAPSKWQNLIVGVNY